MMTACKFSFDDSPEFDGFALGTTWNGFDNVCVTAAERSEIVAWFAEEFPGDADIWQSNLDLLSLPVGDDGLVSLANGYATQISQIGGAA